MLLIGFVFLMWGNCFRLFDWSVLSRSQSVKNGSDTECSYWDQALDGGYGAWSTVGCSLVEESYDKATCQCNHLTNFAVLRVSLEALFK